MGIFNPPLWPQNPGPERCPGLMGMVSLEFLKNPNRLRNRYLFGEEAEGKCKKMISKNLYRPKLFRSASQDNTQDSLAYPRYPWVYAHSVNSFRLFQ
jgi:hypothetical protein